MTDDKSCDNCRYCSADGIECNLVGPCNDRESWKPQGKSKGDVFDDVRRELVRAGHKYSPQFHDAYQALGAITCEYHELLDEIKTHGSPDRVRAEAVQVAAMCCKLVEYLDGKEG